MSVSSLFSSTCWSRGLPLACSPFVLYLSLSLMGSDLQAGKTVCALYLAAVLRRKTLVVVGKSFLCEQWQQRAQTFLPCARVGHIRQDVADVESKDVVIAMLQSLVARGDEYPIHDFGLVIVDECHHICARAFSRALFTIGAQEKPQGNDIVMLGLSATPTRKDGLTDCLHWFFGPTAFHANRPPSQMTGVKVHWRCFSSGGPHPKRHFAEEVNALAACPARNLLIRDEIMRMWRAGRKVLLLSDRREHLHLLQALLCSPSAASSPSSSPNFYSPLPSEAVGFYIGGAKSKELETAARCRLILATYGMASEALDIPALNTLILATPRADVEQSVGRILRDSRSEGADGRLDGVLTALVVDIVDCATSARLDRLAKARGAAFRAAGFTVSVCHRALATSSDEMDGEEGAGEDNLVEGGVASARPRQEQTMCGCELCEVGAYGEVAEGQSMVVASNRRDRATAARGEEEPAGAGEEHAGGALDALSELCSFGYRASSAPGKGAQAGRPGCWLERVAGRGDVALECAADTGRGPAQQPHVCSVCGHKFSAFFPHSCSI